MSGQNMLPAEFTLSRLRSTNGETTGTLTCTFSWKRPKDSRDRGYTGFACVGEGSREAMSSIFARFTDAIKEAEKRGELIVESFASW